MIVQFVTLEDFVEALEEEGPEAIHGSKVSHELRGVHGIVMVGFDHIRTEKLNSWVRCTLATRKIGDFTK
jgi:hypothetical protein